MANNPFATPPRKQHNSWEFLPVLVPGQHSSQAPLTYLTEVDGTGQNRGSRSNDTDGL